MHKRESGWHCFKSRKLKMTNLQRRPSRPTWSPRGWRCEERSSWCRLTKRNGQVLVFKTCFTTEVVWGFVSCFWDHITQCERKCKCAQQREREESSWGNSNSLSAESTESSLLQKHHGQEAEIILCTYVLNIQVMHVPSHVFIFVFLQVLRRLRKYLSCPWAYNGIND